MQCGAAGMSRSVPSMRPNMCDAAFPGDRDTDMIRLGLRLTPHGRLVCEPVADAPGLDGAAPTRLAEAFARGSGDGLLQLGAGEVGQALPPAFAWWRDFAARYVASLCVRAAGTEGGLSGPPVLPEVPPPDQAELDSLVLTAPVMSGAEYLTADV